MVKKAIIMGAAGRDFHNYNVYFRDNQEFRVVAFTATQIPYIANRTYPPSLAGRLYPRGIEIKPEEQLEELIESNRVTDVYFSYSDVSDEYVMHRAAIAQSKGASFHLLGPAVTMLKSKKPVVAVVATRTGAGKSTISRMVVDALIGRRLKAVVVRHPMPYGDLSMAVQRFASFTDLDRFRVTIEEREEYEDHIGRGTIVYAGVDYEAILKRAEKEADVIVWDGGNNDFSFYKPDLTITVADPLRVGDEMRYYPGETNVRLANIVVINKVNIASRKSVEQLVEHCEELNPTATIVRTRSLAVLDRPELVRGKKVLVVEDGPSVTHGGLAEGAGTTAARALNAVPVSARDKTVGSIRAAYERFPKLGDVIPALGYSPTQLRELERSINAVDCDAVVLGTPANLSRLIEIRKPVARVGFEGFSVGKPSLEESISAWFGHLELKAKG